MSSALEMIDTTFLEAFDDAPIAKITPDAAVDEAWQAGFVAATDQCVAETTERGQVAEEQIVLALSDMAFGFAEAQTAILQNLAPLFEAFISQLVPDLVRATLPVHILDAMVMAAEADVTAPLVIHVAADLAPRFEALLTGQTAIPFTCRGDPSLDAGQAVISSAAQETMLDLAGLAAGITDILAAALPAQTEGHAHG